MEDLLPRHFTVGEKEIDPGTPRITRPKRRRDLLPDDEQMTTRLGIEFRKTASLLPRHDENMTTGERPDVHERDSNLVLVDQAGFSVPCNDFGEYRVRIHIP